MAMSRAAVRPAGWSLAACSDSSLAPVLADWRMQDSRVASADSASVDEAASDCHASAVDDCGCSSRVEGLADALDRLDAYPSVADSYSSNSSDSLAVDCSSVACHCVRLDRVVDHSSCSGNVAACFDSSNRSGQVACPSAVVHDSNSFPSDWVRAYPSDSGSSYAADAAVACRPSDLAASSDLVEWAASDESSADSRTDWAPALSAAWRRDSVRWVPSSRDSPWRVACLTRSPVWWRRSPSIDRWRDSRRISPLGSLVRPRRSQHRLCLDLSSTKMSARESRLSVFARDFFHTFSMPYPCQIADVELEASCNVMHVAALIASIRLRVIVHLLRWVVVVVTDIGCQYVIIQVVSLVIVAFLYVFWHGGWEREMIFLCEKLLANLILQVKMAFSRDFKHCTSIESTQQLSLQSQQSQIQRKCRMNCLRK